MNTVRHMLLQGLQWHYDMVNQRVVLQLLVQRAQSGQQPLGPHLPPLGPYLLLLLAQVPCHPLLCQLLEHPGT